MQNHSHKRNLPTTREGRASLLGLEPETMTRYFQMWQAYVDGATGRTIARDFDCSLSTVWQAIKVVQKKRSEGVSRDAQLERLSRGRIQSIEHAKYQIEDKIKEIEQADEIAQNIYNNLLFTEIDGEKRLNPKMLGAFLDMKKEKRDEQYSLLNMLKHVRDDEDKLATYWGVIQQITQSFTQNNVEINVIDGRQHAEIVEIAQQYAQPKLNEPKPEHQFRNTLDPVEQAQDK